VAVKPGPLAKIKIPVHQTGGEAKNYSCPGPPYGPMFMFRRDSHHVPPAPPPLVIDVELTPCAYVRWGATKKKQATVCAPHYFIRHSLFAPASKDRTWYLFLWFFFLASSFARTKQEVSINELAS